MFDMNVLFEQFIAGFIEQKRVLEKTKYANHTLKAQHPQKYLLNENIFKMKPDICLEKAGKIECIIDTKYKRLDTDDRKYDVSSADAYQMYAYSQMYHCERVILLYPKHLEMRDFKHNSFTFNNSKNTLEIRTVNLCRDLKKDIEGLKNKIIEILGKENSANTQ